MRTLKLSTVATVKKAAKSRGIMRFFDRFSSKVAEQAEKNDMAQLEKFIELTKYFREFRIPVEHPLNDAAEKIKALRSIDGAGSNVKDILVVRSPILLKVMSPRHIFNHPQHFLFTLSHYLSSYFEFLIVRYFLCAMTVILFPFFLFHTFSYVTRYIL